MKKFDVICIGEILIDFISEEPGKQLGDVKTFSKFAGGAPANVAVGLTTLGLKTAFAGRVGNDPFGDYLINYLKRHNVNSEHIIRDPLHKTRLAFVGLDLNKERSFEFWEKSPADVNIKSDDYSPEFLSSSRIVHFGSLPLCSAESRDNFFNIISQVNRDNAYISFDPNYRESLWESKEEARILLSKFASKANILKINEQEALFLTKQSYLEKASEVLFGENTVLIAITLGSKGCFIKTRNFFTFVQGFKVKQVDSTGCGDAFLAGLLAKIIKQKRNIESFNEKDLIEIGKFANGTGAIAVTHLGGTESLPTSEEVKMFLEQI